MAANENWTAMNTLPSLDREKRDGGGEGGTPETDSALVFEIVR